MAETNRIQSYLRLFALVLKILLFPVRYALQLLFPTRDLDGLSPAVTAKAAQAFVSFLRTDLSVDTEEWSTTGFQSLKQEALEESSLLFVYLHSPLHRTAVHTARRLFCNDQFQQFLQQPNLKKFGVSIHSGQGMQLAQMLGAASYPLVALLHPTSSSLQLLLCVQGPKLQTIRVPELLTYLSTALTRHQVILAEQEARRMQREQEQELRREQDREYQETLRADQERQRRQQEAIEAERRRQEEAEQEQQDKERKQRESLDRAKALMRDEPASGGTRIRFVLPTGVKLERRFYSDETIGALKSYIFLHSMEQNAGNEDDEDDNVLRNIGLSTSFPRKTYEDDSMSLEEAGLSPQAVLMVQDLDA